MWTLDARASTQRALSHSRAHPGVRNWKRKAGSMYYFWRSSRRCGLLRFLCGVRKRGEAQGSRCEWIWLDSVFTSGLEMKFTTSVDYGAMEKRARLLLSLFFVMSKLCLSEHQVLRIGMFQGSLCFCVQTWAGPCLGLWGASIFKPRFLLRKLI